MNSLAIIDYGMGNLHSIAKAVEHVGADTRIRISADPAHILDADRVIFPGVGAIGHCMEELRRTGLDDVIREVAVSRPLLGVCLGMQALMEHSAENGGTDCLGLIPGRVTRFPADMPDPLTGAALKVPHMGWNAVHHSDHPLWQGIDQDERFYFVHSYYVTPARAEDRAGVCTYGIDFTSAVAHANLFAVQFHPEKSQHAGLQLLANFLRWDGN
ncbi:imidazole glycerol phosphate synthase subunit HisH [Thiohalobacter thiocyanaticus]|uniref:Imidazole glycerol phosphate synthase subunit HisH n=1 Tax=Thiohalobacter thiocyanaticus TaxID=585455 RepID=A0A1Z4VN63_9GAMM|nr:imidazole glycerol phosphate synthase subunit HisH [Thiohalobacter thiocyanaticus]BAZ92788.1 imidazole glycerol phosphate synthase subunit HisH [Thiohalobacter thiocyanaticus]